MAITLDLALIMSALALLFTVFSFWWMNWRPGRLIVTEPRSYAAIAAANKLLIELPFVFFNRGATPIVIHNLRLRVEGVAAPLTFNAVVQNIGDHCNRNFATQFAVRAQEAVSVACEFQRSVTAFQFRAGSYALSLEAAYGAHKQWRTVLAFALRVTEQDMESVNQQLIVHDNWADD